ncbi:MAG TPA: redoxin domain-containing protein [Bryobacteraceae bacterium]|nr:redoxin domain-containing protein [Bryobacteraceae bacterium]
MKIFVILTMSLAAAFVAGQASNAVGQSGVRAVLQPPKARRPAADFALSDASGATARLADYHGKVILLDFWATWCHGCKEEIPWFSEFQRTYGGKDFAVVGISLDDGGWNVVKPFLASANIPYRIVLGNDSIAQNYGIQSMPDTFLIDRQGRVAAAYTTGVVDKADVEANIRTVLSQP